MKLHIQHSFIGVLSISGQSKRMIPFHFDLIVCFMAAFLATGCSDKDIAKQTSGANSGNIGTSTAISRYCQGDDPKTITAEVVALEQIITFNRFGAFNPAGMVYALRQDVVDSRCSLADEDDKNKSCHLDKIDDKDIQQLAGNVRLRKDKRPRPLVLRVNECNYLKVTFWNLLSPLPTVHTKFQRTDFPEGGVQKHSVLVTEPGDPTATDLSTPPRLKPQSKHPLFPFPPQEEPDYPTTRAASIHVNGLDYANIESDGANVGKNTSSLAEPGTSKTYTWYARQEGGYFFYSAGALAGGEGDGGQLGLGLFGSVNVEPQNSVWYRSQVTYGDLTGTKTSSSVHYDDLDYKKLAILDGDNRIVHSDLNAIIYQTDKTNETPEICAKRSPGSSCGMSFREFTTIFHDENKVFQAFAELSDEGNPISAIADGMAINYGSSGVGSVVLANKKQIGPGKDCPDCKLEEFFLSSWVNGDPAMIVKRNMDGKAVEALYPDDPSNVHHSYLGDPVRFRNIHAGPKETHVFHLHAHQWLQDKNDPNANYLDSQTISPGSSYTYDIQYGGGGNRNLTVGDAIFHCHLYPHFAAGMWELWRNHDVFEDGMSSINAHQAKLPDYRIRSLPDYEIKGGTPNPAIVPIPGFPLAPLPTAEFRGYPFFMAAKPGHRPPQPPMDMALNEQTSDPADRLDGGLPRHIITDGTEKKPLSPDELVEGRGDRDANKASRYVAKRTWELNSDPNNLGLAKEIESATVKILPQCGTKDEILAMAYHAGWQQKEIVGLKQGEKPSNMPNTIWLACKDDFKQALVKLDDTLQWNYQSKATVWPINRGIHDSENPRSPLKPMSPLWEGVGYETTNASTQTTGHAPSIADNPGNQFRVNGFSPAQGAPFAEPCPSHYYEYEKATKSIKSVDVNRDNPRLYKSAYIQFDLTVNKYGWHDPQARMPVLEEDAAKTIDGTRLAEPLFFRANSGDCIQFQATNLIPNILNLDDFQVYSPTDTIGQHIHLVKFDVTSSDGSANGWNYEDGTFSPDEVRERIEASKHGKVIQWDGQQHAKLEWADYKLPNGSAHTDTLGKCSSNAGDNNKNHPWCGAQATVQRWWADPVLNDKWDDRTMRAVFTHDHYGPSSHQQHGFYAALIVERKDTVWTKLSGSPAEVDSEHDNQAKCLEKTLSGSYVNNVVKQPCRADGGPTSYAANIGLPKNHSHQDDTEHQHVIKREYNLAFADFAILYNADLRPVNPPSRQADLMLPDVVRDGLKPKPEGISTEDPGTRLLNYRNEPIPLRIAEEDENSLEYHQKKLVHHDLLLKPITNTKELPNEGRNLIIAAIKEDKLHIRIFDPCGKKLIDKPEDELTSGEKLKNLKIFLKPILSESSLRKDQKQKIIEEVALIAGYSPGNMADVFSSVIHDKCEPELQTGNERIKKLMANAPHEIIDKALLTSLLDEQKKKTEDFKKLIGKNEPWRLDGDPSTPVLPGYAGDNINIQLIQGAQEEQHVFSINGINWLAEPKSKNSGYMNGQQIGISEHFEMELKLPNANMLTDYWFGSPSVENYWDGMWGLVRSMGGQKIFLPENALKQPMVAPQNTTENPIRADRRKRLEGLFKFTAADQSDKSKQVPGTGKVDRILDALAVLPNPNIDAISQAPDLHQLSEEELEPDFNSNRFSKKLLESFSSDQQGQRIREKILSRLKTKSETGILAHIYENYDKLSEKVNGLLNKETASADAKAVHESYQRFFNKEVWNMQPCPFSAYNASNDHMKHVVAVLAEDILKDGKKLNYNEYFKITDQQGIAFIELDSDWATEQENKAKKTYLSLNDNPESANSSNAVSRVAETSKGKSYPIPAREIIEKLKADYQHGKSIEPLVLRASAGECIQVTLHSLLPENFLDGSHDNLQGLDAWSYNLMPPIVSGFNFNQAQMSSTVNLIPQLVAYDVKEMGGGNIGANKSFNPESKTKGLPGCRKTAGDGKADFSGCDNNTAEYIWYAGKRQVLDRKTYEEYKNKQALAVECPVYTAIHHIPLIKISGYLCHTPIEYGVASLRSFGDVIKQSSHGAVGALVIEPAGSTAQFPVENSRTTADIVDEKTGKVLFREFVAVFQDDLSLHQNGQPMPNHRMADDAEDTGQKGFNYRTEPLWARNGVGTSGADFNELNRVDYTNTLSSTAPNLGCGSKACGDPDTPVFKAKAGSDIRFRLVHPNGHSRQHAFVLHGHNWDYQPWKNDSTEIATPEEKEVKTARVGAIGGIGPGRHFNIVTTAGGVNGVPGDYLFRVQENFQFHGGMWGILRVEKE